MTPQRIAYRTGLAVSWISSFLMIRVRCDSAVCPAEPAKAPTSGIRDRLPTPQPLCEQFRAAPIVQPVEDAHVLWIRAHVDAGGARVQVWLRVRPRRPVPGRAVGGLQPDLPLPIQLRRVGVDGPFAL